MNFAVKDPKKINRITFTNPDETEELNSEVICKARNNFAIEGKLFGRGEFYDVLKKLDICPLNSNEVELYKLSKEKEYMISGTKKYWSLLALFISIVSIEICCWNFFGWGKIDTVVNDSCIAFTVLSIVATLSFAGAGASELKDYGTQTIDKWVKKSLVGYTGYIPIHILHLANQIKEEQFGTSFTVHELVRITNGIQKLLPDPFLEVSYKGESFYIGVWDERDFEAKL